MMRIFLVFLGVLLISVFACKSSDFAVIADFDNDKTSVSSRNPFAPGKKVALAHPKANASQLGSAAEPFNAMKLVGTVTGLAEPMALLLGKSGKTYVVKIGDFVSHDYAKVTKIDNDTITVQHTLNNGTTARTWELKTLNIGGQ